MSPSSSYQSVANRNNTGSLGEPPLPSFNHPAKLQGAWERCTCASMHRRTCMHTHLLFVYFCFCHQICKKNRRRGNAWRSERQLVRGSHFLRLSLTWKRIQLLQLQFKSDTFWEMPSQEGVSSPLSVCCFHWFCIHSFIHTLPMMIGKFRLSLNCLSSWNLTDRFLALMMLQLSKLPYEQTEMSAKSVVKLSKEISNVFPAVFQENYFDSIVPVNILNVLTCETMLWKYTHVYI